jgi:hypothetical protein
MKELGPASESLLHDERKGCKEWIVYSRRGKKGISNVNE